MKKLLKSAICGICEQCMSTLFTIDLSTIAGLTKKKGLKTCMRNANAQSKPH